MGGLLGTQTQPDYYGNSDNFGNYQFTSLQDIINQFIVAYIGDGKIIDRAKRVDVAFHAQRAMQELSFDTFKSCKSQEITVSANLQMILPQDYVNYTKISWVDSSGIKHPLYPTNRTSNPTNIIQNSDNSISNVKMSATFTSGSMNVVLDDLYDIPIGSFVTGEILQTRKIKQHTKIDGVSVIQLIASGGMSGADFTPTASYKETLTVSQLSGATNNLNTTIKGIRTVAITSAPWETGGKLITFDNDSDTVDIEVGMIINEYPSFSVGTKVESVEGKYVVVNNAATTSPTSSSSLFFTYQETDSDTWSNYKSATPSENNNDDYEDDTYWPIDGNRYGLDPQHAQVNGSFYIDCKSGKIHFSSNISGKTVILDYISDSLGTDDEMQVHKFAEEAMYKWIAHAILASKANVPEYQVNRFKKERFAAVRTAKLRLSNIKLEEITQILRGKSKQIKH